MMKPIQDNAGKLLFSHTCQAYYPHGVRSVTYREQTGLTQIAVEIALDPLLFISR